MGMGLENLLVLETAKCGTKEKGEWNLPQTRLRDIPQNSIVDFLPQKVNYRQLLNSMIIEDVSRFIQSRNDFRHQVKFILFSNGTQLPYQEGENSSPQLAGYDGPVDIRKKLSSVKFLLTNIVLIFEMDTSDWDLGELRKSLGVAGIIGFTPPEPMQKNALAATFFLIFYLNYCKAKVDLKKNNKFTLARVLRTLKAEPYRAILEGAGVNFHFKRPWSR
jgi:hypothetical protein